MTTYILSIMSLGGKKCHNPNNLCTPKRNQLPSTYYKTEIMEQSGYAFYNADILRIFDMPSAHNLATMVAFW